MYCKYCGKQVSEYAFVCPECGAMVNDKLKKKFDALAESESLKALKPSKNSKSDLSDKTNGKKQPELFGETEKFPLCRLKSFWLIFGAACLFVVMYAAACMFPGSADVIMMICYSACFVLSLVAFILSFSEIKSGKASKTVNIVYLFIMIACIVGIPGSLIRVY